MAEQIPFSIAEEILTELGSLVAQEIGLTCGVREELKKLADTLTTIKANWVRRFKDVIYDADDLLDDFATYELRRGGMARQVSRFFSSSNQVAFHFRMGHRIKYIRGRLDGTANDISKFNFIPRATTSMRGIRGESHAFGLESEIIGRDEDKEKIIEILLQSNNQETVVAIVGIGGLGKTALAQLVYDDEKVENHFDIRLWVCVSDDFDVKILVRNIIKSATDRDVENLELDQLKNKLHEELTEKRYLLVLDDVWNEDFEKWNQLRILLEVGARGSKVVVTTRNSNVASIMGIDSPFVLEGLNEGQSWALFKSQAFGEDQQNAPPNLLKIGEEITKMCNGVPLVIRTLGRIPKSKWSSIKNNKNLMSLQDGNNILKVLKLSYDNLPSHLKQCFTYCALFPKDYRIEKKMLIQLWMAQGYIQPLDENEHLEDVGDQYFEELLSWSMFQDVKIDNNNNIISCKMHDLIHDLAQFIVKSEIFILTNDTTDVKTIPERIYHVSILGWSQGMKVVSRPYWGGFKVLPSGITSLQNLQTLKLDGYDCWSLDYMPCRLGELTMLQTLRLRNLNALEYMFRNSSSVEPFPSLKTLELDMLFNFKGWWRERGEQAPSFPSLSQLLIRVCTSLRELPMRKMRSLRHLEIHQCYRLNYMPCRLGELTMLQTLRLRSLDVLNTCSETLHQQSHSHLLKHSSWMGEQAPSSLSQLLIRDCDKLTTVQLPSCPSLSKLMIESCNQLTTVQLPSCPSLSKLMIESCNQLTTVQLPSCPSLSKLGISGCNELTTFQLLSSPHLSKLVIRGCGSLECLQLPSCPSLSELQNIRCDQLTTVQLQLPPSLPCLEELKLVGVREEILWQIILVSSSLKSLHIGKMLVLVSLPDDLLQHLTSLKSLKINYFSGLMFLFEGFNILPHWKLSKLMILQIRRCPRFKLEDRSKIAHIREIDIQDCSEL
ncbi:hypothetical protein AAG906_026525 [Vitis piasezkii]